MLAKPRDAVAHRIATGVVVDELGHRAQHGVLELLVWEVGSLELALELALELELELGLGLALALALALGLELGLELAWG